MHVVPSMNNILTLNFSFAHKCNFYQQGRFIKKIGAVVQDFKEKCNEIDERKQHERQGQPTTKEMMSAAMLDLKAQIDEYEKIVNSKKTAAKGDK